MSIHVWGTPPEDEQPPYQTAYQPAARPKPGCFEAVTGIIALGCGLLMLTGVGIIILAFIIGIFS